MRYTIQNNSHRGDFSVLNNYQNSVAKLTFSSWMNSNAAARISDKEITFKSSDLWGLRFTAFQKSNPLASIRLTGMGYVKIDFEGQVYTLKYRGFFNYRYELQDANGSSVLVFHPVFNWKSFTYNYNIEVINPFIKEEDIYKLLVFSAYGLGIKSRNGY